MPATSIDLWTRIKEHKIAQWTLAYAAAAYALLDGTKIVSDAFDWPHQVLRIVTVLLILGLPMVVTLAWYHGHRALHRVSGRELTIITMLLVVAGGVLWRFARTPRELASPTATSVAAVPVHAAVSPRSVAVLPFADMSEKHDQEYFADGMAEEIIERLSQVPSLHVPGQASSFYFKGKTTKLSEIAHELGVANVVEGSVRKSGDHLRIGAQLVRVSDGYTVWSQSFDRKLADVFRIQDEIATAVANGLQTTLGGGSLTREIGGTRNLEAYQLYLRALSRFREDNADALQASRTMLEGATEMDPGFGLAWAQLSIVLMNLADTGALLAADGSERARRAAIRAIAVSPGLGDAHAALGFVYRTYDWNWPAAAAESQRALALDPTGLNAMELAGLLAVTLGHGDEAVRWHRKVLARDPLYSFAHFNLGNALYLSGRYAEAEAVFRRLVTLQEKYAWGHPWLAKTLIAEGKPQEALATLLPLMDDGDALLYLSETLLANGRKAEADTAVQRLAKEQGDASAYYVAQYYAYAHDRDQAMQWLERAYAQRDTGLIEIVGEPLLRNLWGDPRYNAFLRKMKLPET